MIFMDVDPIAKLRADLEADPNDPGAHLRLAKHHYEQGDHDTAATEAQRALQLGLESAEARLLLGKAWMRQGCPTEAAFQFAQLLARYPDHAEATACHESIRRTTAVIDVIRSTNPRELQLEVRHHIVVLTLAGMMAPYTDAGDLRQPFERLAVAIARLLQLGQIGCVVDLAKVDFVTSFFLGKLLEWRRKLIGATYGMAICNPRPEIHQLLTSTRVSRQIPIVGSLDRAIRVVQQASGQTPPHAEPPPAQASR